MTLAERPSPAMEETRIEAWTARERTGRSDVVAVEEPLEIRLAGYSVAVTMRTPGHDFDLAAGFLCTERILRKPSDIATMAHCPSDDPEADGNIVNVNPTDVSIADPARWRRDFFVTSSCGICGKAGIAAIKQETRPIESAARIAAGTLLRLDEALRGAQEGFSRTGGVHAAALFDLDGRMVAHREDIGRHNAVDKVIGDRFRAGALPLDGHVLMVSSRASFEIVQKALVAGIPIVATVSAPSSLAVELAREAGMTLVGFLRPGRFNVYAGGERVDG